jgi:hypothetical protein
MARRKDSILNDLIELPWQVSVILSAGVFIVLKFILPIFSFDNFVFEAVATNLTINVRSFPRSYTFVNQGQQFWGCSDYPKCRYTDSAS